MSGNTHCRNGHSYEVYGRYGNGQCRQCKREANKRRAELAGSWHPKRRDKSWSVPGRKSTTDLADEQARTLIIARLIDAKWRAATVWERQEIQNRIDAWTNGKPDDETSREIAQQARESRQA